MALLPIIQAPDPRLKKKSSPVFEVTNEIRQLLEDMLETMYNALGIGLAAPQVGQTIRVIVVDVADEDKSRVPLKMINPEIISASETQGVYNEGCLSLPEQYGEVTRPEEITVQYLDSQGDRQQLKADGLLATCIQHEIDHLDGVLFIDHLSQIKKDMLLRKLKKYKKARLAR